MANLWFQNYHDFNVRVLVFSHTVSNKQDHCTYGSSVGRCSFYSYGNTNDDNDVLVWNSTEPYHFVNNWTLRQRNYGCHRHSNNYDFSNCFWTVKVSMRVVVVSVNFAYANSRTDWSWCDQFFQRFDRNWVDNQRVGNWWVSHRQWFSVVVFRDKFLTVKLCHSVVDVDNTEFQC